MDTSSVLFGKAMPVTIKRAPGEERQAQLVVRVRRNAKKVLRIELGDEMDPFFFHTAEVSEDEFLSLKVEQAILVDFITFPYKIIELLERCIQADDRSSCRFLAVLDVRTGDSTFSIMEINQFKHLYHLALCFRQGNEATIKACLTARLAELKETNAGLHEKLQCSLESQQKSSKDIEELKREIIKMKEAQHLSLAELGAKHKMDLAALTEKGMQECIQVKEKLDKDRADMEYRLRQRADVQEDHASELHKQLKEALSRRHHLELKIAKIEVLQRDLGEKQQENEKLRSRNEQLESENQKCSKKMNQYLIKLATLELEVQSRRELLLNMTNRLDIETSHRTALEKALRDAQAAAERAEEKAITCTSEANKCCQSVERLQGELRACKAKAKLKAHVVQQQDILLHDRQCSLEKREANMNTLRQELATLKQENDMLRKRADDSEEKLEKMQELSKSNEGMIEWLNQQLTDYKLGKFGASCRHSFRSSSDSSPRGIGNSTVTSLAGLKAAHSYHNFSPRSQTTVSVFTSEDADTSQRAYRRTALTRPFEQSSSRGAYSPRSPLVSTR